MSIKLTKRVATKLMKRGQSSIRIKPTAIDNANKAITADDVRDMIAKGEVYAIKEKKNISAYGKTRRTKRAKGRSRGKGRRKGTLKARGFVEYKKKVRAQRRVIKFLKEQNVVNGEAFKKYYRLVKGGTFHSKITLINRIKSDGVPLNDEMTEKLRKI